MKAPTDIIQLAEKAGMIPRPWQNPATIYDIQEFLPTIGIRFWVSPCMISSSGGWGYNRQHFNNGTFLTEKIEQYSSVSLSFQEAMVEGITEALNTYLNKK